jgi:hypothetical protein
MRCPGREILFLAAVLRAGAITGECQFFTILRMVCRIVTKDSLVPGTGPTCTQGRTGRRFLIRRI